MKKFTVVIYPTPYRHDVYEVEAETRLQAMETALRSKVGCHIEFMRFLNRSDASGDGKKLIPESAFDFVAAAYSVLGRERKAFAFPAPAHA